MPQKPVFVERVLNAFTLVELAIVLIIIGFIVAGISAGSSMAEAAKLNGVILEAQEYVSAVNNFRGRYNAFPGDYANAGVTWPGNQAGNGDGYIQPWTPNDTNRDEITLAWRHLSLAGMVNSAYTGVNTVAKQADPGINVPASMFGGNSAFNFDGNGCYPSRRYLIFGSFRTGDLAINIALSPLQIATIDRKVDDGAPGTGNVMTPDFDVTNSYTTCFWGATYGGNTNCAVASTNTYTSSTTKNCRFYWTYHIP